MGKRGLSTGQRTEAKGMPTGRSSSEGQLHLSLKAEFPRIREWRVILSEIERGPRMSQVNHFTYQLSL